jgi:glycosyltransferase involved in cell wall biosynthesis
MVIIHGLWTYTTMGALGPLRRSKKPYFVFTHGALDPWFRRTYPIKHLIKQLFWWVGDGRVLSGARHVLFTTEDEKLLARNAFLNYSVNEQVIRYGIADPPPESPEQKKAFEDAVPEMKGKRYLLYLSRIHPKKGCDLLMEAFGSMSHLDPDIHLVMAGPDETRWRDELEKIARKERVADRIVWPGSLRGDAKWGAFRGSEAFVLPSHQENFGIVVAEALACGRPVLISDQVNIWREIEKYEAGIVAPDTLEGTIDMLRAWARQTPEQRQAQSAAARKCFLDCFEIKNTSTDILGLVRAALAHDDS